MSKFSAKRWGFKTFPAEMGLIAGFILWIKIKRSYQKVSMSIMLCYHLSGLFS